LTRSPSHALVLAGSRGPTDPVACANGLPHKALVPVLGVPMLLRVVQTLLACPGIEHLILCLDPALNEHGLGLELDRLIDAGTVEIAEPRPSPSESVAAVVDRLEQQDDAWPLLVTTADHPLLTAAMVGHFTEAMPDDADFILGLAEASLIRQRYPNAIRTFYRFGGKGYSGCNLFMLTNPNAGAVITFWQTMEKHRKRPWRLVAAIGPSVLIRFLTGRLTIEAALEHLSKRIGARVSAVIMPFAEAAIDVDKPGDLILAETILKARIELR
jgi:CTP:molybdopterin cytidylyltransferase MocA